jgi:4-hydroxy-tetrahydrodipicolinate reductase
MAESNLKIGIVGYGQMGRMIEALANVGNIQIGGIYDIDNPLSTSSEHDYDVAIDFSAPDSVLDNIKFLSGIGKNVVVGTTGWHDKLEEVREIVGKNKTGLVFGSNFSVGMNMMYSIIRTAAEKVNSFPEYDIMLNEIHHKRKKDSPSGTALSIASIITEEVNRKKRILGETIHGAIASDELHISSIRGGEIPGTHTVIIDSPADTIEITHRAKSREGFAAGALLAAKWIAGKTGFFEFSDIFDQIS